MLVEPEKSGKKTGTPGIVPGKETCTIWRIYTSVTLSKSVLPMEAGKYALQCIQGDFTVLGTSQKFIRACGRGVEESDCR